MPDRTRPESCQVKERRLRQPLSRGGEVTYPMDHHVTINADFAVLIRGQVGVRIIEAISEL